jgi:precorrin-2 dehydrogenase/sirohydrochlorin ferrochelatase
VRFLYPMMLDLSGRLVVIIGGGAVAARKAAGVLAARAMRVKVIAPEICEAMPQVVERLLKKYSPEHLAGAGLVFAATNSPEVNAAVVRDAHELGIWVNRADFSEDHGGDFSTPALLREDELLITVSAGGNPALAAAIRDEMKNRLDARWSQMATAMKTVRPRVLREVISEEVRRAMLRDLASIEALEVLERGGIDGLWSWLTQRHLEQG